MLIWQVLGWLSLLSRVTITHLFASSFLDRLYLSLFQDKPTLRDSSNSTGHCDRPQSVTRHLFAPLTTAVQQQEQQQQRQQQLEQPQLSCRPQTATASIFAPRTEDMNKGFLTFSEDQPGLTSAYSPLQKKNRNLFRNEKEIADPCPYRRLLKKKKIWGSKIRKNMTHESRIL